MDVIFGLLGLLFLLSVLAGVLFFAIYMARKIGWIKVSNAVGDEEGKGGALQSYFSDIKQVSDSLLFRFVVIAVLVGVMTIPLGMVSDVVKERSQLYRGVLNDIAATWGHRQNLQGPALFIPYTEKFVSEIIKTDKDGNQRKENKTQYKQRTAILLPNDLDIKVEILSQKRKRSLYESLVYTADLKINGSFQRENLKNLSNHIDKIHWDRAWLALGISDTQAINKVTALSWFRVGENKASKIDFEPGTRAIKTLSSGFHAPLDLTQSNDDVHLKDEYHFSLVVNINGSQGFYFSPFGKITDVSIQSDWPHPSFRGNVLPDHHQINDKGFKARWSIPNLARNYPQLWTLETQPFNVNEFSAGVNLFESVSMYSQITRAIKYGVLFFVLTYITFLIFELGIGRRLHIVQYGMIGLALSMFYLTLLSMAEHAGFFTAYLSAVAIIILMISLYAFAAIRSVGHTGLIALLLMGLYALLYSLLKLEDYALLAGTILLLLLLGVMMYLTRNIGKTSKT